ncbi:MAG: flavin-containing monooxygenase [Candidatus Reddybacter sp.]
MGHAENIANLNSCWAKEGRTPRIAIVGAGLSGIGAVIALRQAGYTDLTVYEKADKIGGTWRDNRYPGLSCDVPSYWYSYSFEPNSSWSHRFSYGPEIFKYAEHVAKKYDVMSVVNLNSPVTEMTYLGPKWRLKAEGHEEQIFDFLISATGILHHPSYPDIKGINSFKGAMFHTARWDDSVSLDGKKVGIIGTGSTSAQIVGEVTKKVQKMSVFQRTPHWMAPLPQKKYSPFWKMLLRVCPWIHPRLSDFYKDQMLSTFAKATVGDVNEQQKIEHVCKKALAQDVPDPELRAKLTPSYKATCKRLILCSDFYPAISRDNAELVTDAIEGIEPEGIRTKDGRLHELDVLLIATGFKVSEFMLPAKVFGENKLELSEVWDGAPRAHRAMTIPSFPNFWMLEGPTGPVGNLSLISVTETQLGYMIQCLDQMKAEKAASIAVKQEVFEAFNKAMAKEVLGTTWATGGCDSWYIDKTGTPNLYPWHPSRFYEEMQQPDFSEYHFSQEVTSEA